MKKSLLFILSTLFISFGAFAQSWNLTGNNNATPTSILGTTNSVPLRLFTKNAVRLTIDTFGFVGINSAHPVSTLDVRGTQFLQGTLKFSTGANGIQFANPTSTSNKPMMYMFTSGSSNLSRMVIAHSPAFPNYGLQYDDVNDNFNFSGGSIVMTVGLGSGTVFINNNAIIGANAIINADADIAGNAIITGYANVTGNGNFGGTTPPNNYRAYFNHGLFGLGIQHHGAADFWELWHSSFDNKFYLFFDNGTRGNFDPTSGAYTSISDARLKTNIKPMETVLEKINQLKASSYQFKDMKDQQFYDGFIAQDVMKIFPNLVYHNINKERNLDVYTMNYSG
ncbi:MAG: tail fiber domain-containing protein, partial [Flavisolibacter sp.]